MKRIHSILIVLFAVLIFNACKKEKLVELNAGYGYAQYKPGQYTEFSVDSIVYDEFNQTVDTYRYFLKELIAESFVDHAGLSALRIERYQRAQDTAQWAITDVWTSNLNAATFEKTENNERFVKMVFPVKDGKSWNGNSFNTLGFQEYKFDEVDVPYSTGNFAFDSSATVVQIDEFNLILRDYSVEVYAKNVGLVFKEFISVKTLTNGVIKSGVSYRYKLKGYSL